MEARYIDRDTSTTLMFRMDISKELAKKAKKEEKRKRKEEEKEEGVSEEE